MIQQQNFIIKKDILKNIQFVLFLNFISLCREYNNYITTLLENDAYMNELFSLVAFTDQNSLTKMTVISEYQYVSEHLHSHNTVSHHDELSYSRE